LLQKEGENHEGDCEYQSSGEEESRIEIEDSEECKDEKQGQKKEGYEQRSNY